MNNRKERKKVIKELLDITDKEFTDEELIHQLTMTEIVENTNKDEKNTCGCTLCGKLGVYIQLYCRYDCLDGA